jgi:peptidoglycan hydrolase-like protein with peptidoglycan-binding domain
VFSSAGDAAQLFNSDVEAVVGNIKTIVEQATSPLTSSLSFPWEDTASDAGPISTFSSGVEDAINGVINKAKTDYQAIKNYLSQPFTDAGAAVETFKSDTITKLNAVIKKAEETATALGNLADTGTPDHVDTDGGGGGGKKITIPKEPTRAVLKQDTPGVEVEHLQKILNQFFSAKLRVDGIYGSATKSAVANMQNWLSITPSGKYDQKTKDAMQKWLNQRNVSSWFREVGFGVPAAMYAKGTLGTKQDQWAITDEPQYGDELVLIPNAAGNLSYMRKGTSVVPADITKNLMEWGQLNPNMDMSSAVQGVNVMTNVVNKPETNLHFENLLHIDNCTKEVLPEVKKIITEQLESFTKKLNYNLKRVGSTT